jgi:hypothetical protein
MFTPGKGMRSLVLVSALVASVCACKERPGSSPALWDPIDTNFKGCEGG